MNRLGSSVRVRIVRDAMARPSSSSVMTHDLTSPMGFFRDLRLQWAPPRRLDADFGELTFIFIPNAPARSYWEAEWTFPPTGTKVSIALDGDEAGPSQGAREFFLAIPARFPGLIETVRPALDQVFLRWYGRPLARDPWQDLTLAGFGLESVDADGASWDVSFEATGEKWLGIRVPIRGERVLEAEVDT